MIELRHYISCSLLYLVKVARASIQTDAKADSGKSQSDDSDDGSVDSSTRDISALLIGGWYVFRGFRRLY